MEKAGIRPPRYEDVVDVEGLSDDEDGVFEEGVERVVREGVRRLRGEGGIEEKGAGGW